MVLFEKVMLLRLTIDITNGIMNGKSRVAQKALSAV